MSIIDTHTHLYSESFDQDRDQVIQRALDSNVNHFILPAIDSEYYKGMFSLKEKYPEKISLMTGVHPTHVKSDTYKKELEVVKKYLDKGGFCAVGEIGIDLYWDTSTLAIQQEAFAQQLRWAKAYDLPIAIHCREAFEEVFEVLEREKADSLRGVFHCFTGTKEDAERAIDLNLKLGIGGVATFKNGKIDHFLSEIDLSHIVLETDAPYLAPKPFRGKRNESAYITHIASRLAEIYDKDVNEITKTTTQTAKKIFNLN